MEYRNLASLLEKTKNKIDFLKVFKKDLVDLINKNTNFSVKESDLSIKKKVLFIKTTPLKKGEIVLNKYKLMNLIKENFGESIEDVR